MQYTWIVTYQELLGSTINIRAFSSEYAAITYIEKERELNPTIAKYMDLEKVAAEIDLRDY